MRDQAGYRLVAVVDHDLGGVAADRAPITDLATGLAVERRLIRDQLHAVARAGFLHQRAILDDSQQFAVIAVLFVASEAHRAAWHGRQRLAVHAFHRLVLRLELGALLGRFQGVVVARLVDHEAALRANHVRQIEREAVRVVKLERVRAGQRGLAVLGHQFEALFEQRKAALDGLPEAHFFVLGDRRDVVLALAQLRVLVAHGIHHAQRHLVQERLFDAEPVAMTDRTAHHSAITRIDTSSLSILPP